MTDAYSVRQKARVLSGGIWLELMDVISPPTAYSIGQSKPGTWYSTDSSIV